MSNNTLCQRLQFFSPIDGPLKKISLPREILPTSENENKKHRQSLSYGDYSSIVNLQIKILAIFPGTFGISRNFQIFIHYYSTTSCGTSNDVLRNSDWETLRYAIRRVDCM